MKTTTQIIDKWHRAMISRPGLSPDTARTITTRIRTMKKVIGNDADFDRKTLDRILAMPKGYVYTHRIAKTFTWIADWAHDEGFRKKNTLKKIKMRRPSYAHTKVFLTADELRKIESQSLPSHLAYIRVLFILQCRTGWAYSDLKNIPRAIIYEANGREWITLHRSKPPFKPMITPSTQEIKDLIGQVKEVPTNQYYNRCIKEILKLAGIAKKIRSHGARKTCAQQWTDKGLAPALVANILANTEKVLHEHYISITEKTLDVGLKNIGA